MSDNFTPLLEVAEKIEENNNVLSMADYKRKKKPEPKVKFVDNSRTTNQQQSQQNKPKSEKDRKIDNALYKWGNHHVSKKDKPT